MPAFPVDDDRSRDWAPRAVDDPNPSSKAARVSCNHRRAVLRPGALVPTRLLRVGSNASGFVAIPGDVANDAALGTGKTEKRPSPTDGIGFGFMPLSRSLKEAAASQPKTFGRPTLRPAVKTTHRSHSWHKSPQNRATLCHFCSIQHCLYLTGSLARAACEIRPRPLILGDPYLPQLGNLSIDVTTAHHHA
jgi:hypothetical protein